MENPTKKAVGYVRISSIKQIDNESPDTQRDKIQQYADANGIEIIKWYFDEAKSGKNAEREELQNLLKYALQYKGQIDHVIVYKMNRASRDLDSYVQQVRLVLKARGITVRSATEPIDDTKMGRFMEGLFVLLGQLDNDSKSEYTVDNMKALAMQGYWQHPPLHGYEPYKIMNESGKPRPSMKPNAMAKKVKAVLERFCVGDITKAELTRHAAEIGLRSRNGNTLTESSINKLLETPEYAGYVHDIFTNYELVAGKHEPIISKETYEINQALLQKYRSQRNGEKHLKYNAEYPLKGLLLCPSCSNPLYASAPKTGNGGRSPRYHCARQSCKGKVPSMRAKLVHEDFTNMLTHIKPSEEILSLYKKVLKNELKNELGGINNKITRARNELNKVAELRSKATQKYLEDLISLEDKDVLIAGYEKRKLELMLELKELESQQSFSESDIEFAINFMEQIDKQWDAAPYDIQQRFQKMIFPEGLVYDSKTREFGTSSISPLYRVIKTKKGTEVPLNSNLVAGTGLEPVTSWL